jgi:hypothetical protein
LNVGEKLWEASYRSEYSARAGSYATLLINPQYRQNIKTISPVGYRIASDREEIRTQLFAGAERVM